MEARIQVRELPVRPSDAQYQFAWRLGRKERSRPLQEGDIVVGASSRNDISIDAAGVRSRHFRLKRHGGDLFIQSLGTARVLMHGEPIEGLVRLPLGEPFTFGGVRAVVERVAAGDASPAIQIERSATAPVEEGDSGTSPVRQLRWLNDSLERCTKASDSSLLMDTLNNCLAPVWAGLFRREGAGEWTMISELAPGGAVEVSRPGEAEGYSRYGVAAGGEEYLLLVRSSSGSNDPWQDEVCRQVLLQAVVNNRPAGETPEATGAGASTSGGRWDDVWRDFVGSSIRARLSASTDICRYSDTVLLLGETGTGKELASHALHRLWEQRGPLLAINCAAIPGDLLDAELFGIEAGAATGVTARPGRIREAESGTLFLDEISELPFHLQTKLLRVLQEREYFSVGGTRLQRAHLKIVAASNQPAAYLQSGHMRQDLYYRLSQATLTMPPLRETKEDLAALCAYFLELLERQFKRGVRGLSLSALELLKACSWPGNVRELQNLLRYLYATAPHGGLIHSRMLPESFRGKEPGPREGTLAAVVEAAERDAIEQALLRHGNNSDAARSLGLSVSYFYRKLKQLRLASPRNARSNAGSVTPDKHG